MTNEYNQSIGQLISVETKKSQYRGKLKSVTENQIVLDPGYNHDNRHNSLLYEYLGKTRAHYTTEEELMSDFGTRIVLNLEHIIGVTELKELKVKK